MRIFTDRTTLLQAVDRLEVRGGFADALGKAALLADNENLKRLINAFPEFFEGQASLRLVK
jgi:hypothetical protein